MVSLSDTVFLCTSGSQSFGLHFGDSEPPDLNQTVEEEALISVDLELLNENSPSNTMGKGALQIATLQFNNLDIIGQKVDRVFTRIFAYVTVTVLHIEVISEM